MYYLFKFNFHSETLQSLTTHHRRMKEYRYGQDKAQDLSLFILLSGTQSHIDIFSLYANCKFKKLY